MIKRFEVENYMGFKNKIVWDFSQTRDYSYGKNLVSHHISQHSIVFGKNGSGKSSITLALMDLTHHLVDKQKHLIPEYRYTFIGNNSPIASFKYDFFLENKNITYIYYKNGSGELFYESLWVNNKEMVRHDFVDETNNFIKFKEAKTLRTAGLPKQISVIKFIYNNTIQSADSPISLLMRFVFGMLFFKSLRDQNLYIGFKLGSDNIDEIIVKENKLNEFKQFLEKFDLTYNFVPCVRPNGRQTIGVLFDNKQIIPFEEIASSGTITLALFFYWLLDFGKLSMLIIDEFDAYYNNEISEKLIEIINNFRGLQSVVTTHNVTLLSTEQTRPDCAYIIDSKGIINLSNRTTKELRKNNNIEKMYRQGEFNMSN